MKFFVISDIHSYYNLMIKALDTAGFDKDNPDHALIVCGDAFDRGTQAVEMLAYLDSLERKILIKGNHDDLLIELLERKVPAAVDYYNGTMGTVYQLGYEKGVDKFSDICDIAYRRYKPLYDKMTDYFETEKYIFVHSWIPIGRQKKLSEHYAGNFNQLFNDNWRSAAAEEWKDARWGNPYQLAEMGLKPDKTVVFGHWHTSWPRAYIDGGEEFGNNADFSIYYGKGYIGLDAMTSTTGKVNVLVIEDNLI